MIKAVLFDMDGTLVNTLEDLAEAVNYAFAQYGLAPRPIENFRSYAGSGTKVMLQRALNGEAPPVPIEKIIKVFSRYYGIHFCDHTRPYPGMIQTVNALCAGGLKLGVVTNKMQLMSEQLANRLFPGCFSTVQGQRDPYPTKPDPTLPRMAASELNVRNEECLFVGDSDIDILTAHNFGAKAAGALWGFRTRDELAAQRAEYLIADPREILHIVGEENDVRRI